MIARERPLCDCPDWWHEFPAEAVEKGHDYGVAGLDRGHEVLPVRPIQHATAQTRSPAWNCSVAELASVRRDHDQTAAGTRGMDDFNTAAGVPQQPEATHRGVPAAP